MKDLLLTYSLKHSCFGLTDGTTWYKLWSLPNTMSHDDIYNAAKKIADKMGRGLIDEIEGD